MTNYTSLYRDRVNSIRARAKVVFGTFVNMSEASIYAPSYVQNLMNFHDICPTALDHLEDVLEAEEAWVKTGAAL